MPTGLSAQLFGRQIESPIGIAAGPLPNSRWVEAYSRLGYGLLTYKTVRTAARAALKPPNIVHCRPDHPAVTRPAPRQLDPGRTTWAVSMGLPSAEPDEWRADVSRARSRIRPGQVLIVSVAGTPIPGAGQEQIADDYALCARWAAEAGADVVEVHLSGPNMGAEQPQMISESPALSAYIVDQVRRAVGQVPVVAKLGATRSPRALHELATRLAPWLDGFVLVNGLQQKVVKPAGTPGFPGGGRDVATVVGGDVYEQCHVQVEELLAWRRAGAWNRAILAVGGLTTVERLRRALEAGADAAMVATAALVDPLIAARALTSMAS